MKKIVAYGIRTHDRIYRLADTEDGQIVTPAIERNGGVDNFVNGLRGMADTLVRTQGEDAGIVDIVIMPDGTKRTLLPYGGWPMCTKFMANPDADWHHLMYLDTCNFDDWFFDSMKTGLVSGDVAFDLESVMDMLPRLDFLFVSMENCKNLLEQAAQLVKKAVIVHTGNGVSVVSRWLGRSTFNFKHLNNVNNIGAGDYFAARFIDEYMSSEDAPMAAKCAASATTAYLKENEQWVS